MRLRELHFFSIGFFIGSFVVLVPFIFYKDHQVTAKQKFDRRLIFHEQSEVEGQKLYNETLSNKLFNEVKILCMIMTHPENHRTKAVHVKNTWGRRCNKLVFISSKLDLILDTVVLPIVESREALWNKTKASFQYLYEHYRQDYDYFMKADDDNYVIVENLRYMLAHYNPKTALYFGHRYSVRGLDEGYMAGGGYILSNKALEKFAETLLHNATVCHPEGGAEDWEMGRCLEHSAIFVDCRDELHQKRFFPVGAEEHMRKNVDPSYWYTMNQYYHVPQGSPDCCSDTSVGFHYIGPRELYSLEYFIYHVHPFGIDYNSTEAFPKRFTLQDVIAASDVESKSANFKKHRNYHFTEPSEVY